MKSLNLLLLHLLSLYRNVETHCRNVGLEDCFRKRVGEWFRKNRDTKPVPGDYTQLRTFFDKLLIDEDTGQEIT